MTSVQTTMPVLRQSYLKALVQCPQYALWRYHCSLGRKGYKSAPSIGTMFHLALGLRYKGRDEMNASKCVSEWVEAELAKIQAYGRSPGGDPQVADRQSIQLEQDAALARAMAHVHWTKHPLNPKRYKVIAVEKTLELKDARTLAVLQGTIDLILYSPELKGYVLVDHKTTSRSVNNYMASLEFDLQARIYRYLFTEALQQGLLGDIPKKPVVAFLWNVIRKPTIRLKQTQTTREYLEEVLDWYAGRDDDRGARDPETGEVVTFKSGPRKGLPKPRWEHRDQADVWLSDPPIQQQMIRFGEQVLTNELATVIEMGARASRALPTLTNFPRLGSLTGMCRGHFGRECDYLPLCSKNPGYWDSEIAQKYERLDTPDEEEARDE